MKKMTYLLLTMTLISVMVRSQQLFSPAQINPEKSYENVFVENLYSDSLSSSFIIWVKRQVVLHKHDNHTECIYILEGTADMQIGDENFSIVTGDYLVIPKNTTHSVVVTSRNPLKLISIQSPEFTGDNRILIK